MSENTQTYIEQVLNFVRWKRAHDRISKELSDHIADQKEAFLLEGMEESAAQTAAVQSMGDPALVGPDLDRSYRPHTSRAMLILFGAILLAGILMQVLTGVFSLRYSLTLLLGAGLFFLCWRFLNLARLFRYSAAICLSYALLIWVYCFAVFFSPSLNDFYLPCLLLFQPVLLSLVVYRMKSRRLTGLALCFGYALLTLFPVFFCSGALYMAFTLFADIILFSYAIFKGWFGENRAFLYLISLSVFILALLALTVFSGGYYLNRLFSMLFMPQGVSISSYRAVQAQEILEGCSWLGGYSGPIPPSLPNQLPFSEDFFTAQERLQFYTESFLHTLKTDYLLVWLASKLGLWVFPVFALMVGGFLFAAAKSCCKKQACSFSRLLSVSILLAFGIQWGFYLFSNLGILPPVLPLPFLSHGNTSFLVNTVLAGVLFCVSGSGWIYQNEIHFALPLKRKERA